MPPKLGILAGGGELPGYLISACKASGRDVFVIALEGQADEETVGEASHAWVRLGAAGTILRLLRENGAEELVFAGKVRRPSWRELKPDLRAATFLTKVGRAAIGDDGLLSGIVRELEREGFRVVGPDRVLSGLLARPGPYGAIVPDDEAERDIARGIEVARALGAVDVGQAAVVQAGIVLGVEGAEGTDALVSRCGRLQHDGAGGVLVKVKKPNQEDRMDLPSIGVKTVEAAAASRLRGIAVEAGGALVIDAEQVARSADLAGLFVVGVSVDA